MGKRGPKPGTVTKTGGRKKGTPNKRTELLVKKLDDLGIDVPNEIVRLLGQLDEVDGSLRRDPDDYADDDSSPLQTLTKAIQQAAQRMNVIRTKAMILSDLMQYVHPKRKPQEGPEIPEDPGTTKTYVLYDEDEFNPKV